MLIAIHRAQDFANLLFYLPGIHFDSAAFISNKNFHIKVSSEDQKSVNIRMIVELSELFLIRISLGVGRDNFFHQFMADDILE